MENKSINQLEDWKVVYEISTDTRICNIALRNIEYLEGVLKYTDNNTSVATPVRPHEDIVFYGIQSPAPPTPKS